MHCLAFKASNRYLIAQVEINRYRASAVVGLMYLLDLDLINTSFIGSVHRYFS